jgi:hypothetical protein
LLPPYASREYGGIKVAFVGAGLRSTPQIVPPAGVRGLQFRDEAASVNALVPELRAQGVEAIVVLIHEGGRSSTPAGEAGCADFQGPIIGIVKRLDGYPGSAQADDVVFEITSSRQTAKTGAYMVLRSQQAAAKNSADSGPFDHRCQFEHDAGMPPASRAGVCRWSYSIAPAYAAFLMSASRCAVSHSAHWFRANLRRGSQFAAVSLPRPPGDGPALVFMPLHLRKSP